MAKIVAGGIIATIVVIAVGVIVALPPFLQPPKGASVLLSFNIVNDNNNMPDWCNGLADILSKERVHAVIFFSGVLAEKYPQCVSSFGEDIDIGSSTCSYRSLTGISDYTEQLREVEDAERAWHLTTDNSIPYPRGGVSHR